LSVLALIAAFGIIVADFVPIAPSQWLIWLIAFASVALVLFVGCAFFLLHNFRTGDTPGLKLVDELGERARTVRATGVVTSEPKVAPSGFATFLFNLETSNATVFVRWRGRSHPKRRRRLAVGLRNRARLRTNPSPVFAHGWSQSRRWASAQSR
jgi:hypothetical protein